MLALLLSLSTAASAKPEPPYDDGVLQSFRVVDEGQSCSTNGTTTGTVSDSGNVNANSSSSTTCSPRKKAFYTIVVKGQTLVITPTQSAGTKVGVVASLGWGALFLKDSCLYGQLPGAKFQIRTESPGTYRIKLGKRESLYKLVSAE
jgi:hypothetical protein